MSAPVTAPRVLVMVMTDARTGWAHLVTDVAFTAGCRSGWYWAVCGEQVLAASLAAPEQGYCQLCAHWRVTRATRNGGGS